MAGRAGTTLRSIRRLVWPSSAVRTGWTSIRVAAVKDVNVAGGGGGDDIYFRLAPSSRRVSVDGGGSRDLAILDVRKAGFGKGSTITVDLGSGVLRTRVRAGGVRALEVMAIIGKDERWRFRGTNRSEDLLMQGGREPGGRDARRSRLRRRHTRAGRVGPGQGSRRLRERPQGEGHRDSDLQR